MVSTSKVPWLQKVGSGIPQTVQRGHRNHRGRNHCCHGPENQQRQHCHFTPGKTLCLHGSGTPRLVLYVKHLAQVLPPPSVQSTGVPQELRYSPTSRLYGPCFPVTVSSGKAPLSHPLFCFLGFFFFFSFLSYWWRLPLCGKSLHGRWFCKIPLAVAREMCKGISVFLGQLSWAPNWKAPRKLLIVLWGAEGSHVSWLLTGLPCSVIEITESREIRGSIGLEGTFKITWFQPLCHGEYKTGKKVFWQPEITKTICALGRDGALFLHPHLLISLAENFRRSRLSKGQHLIAIETLSSNQSIFSFYSMSALQGWIWL